jgi:hypothetical protein
MLKIIKLALISLVVSGCTTTSIEVTQENKTAFQAQKPSFQNFEADLALLGAEFVKRYPFNDYREITDNKFVTRYFEDINTYSDKRPSESELKSHKIFQQLVTDYVKEACHQENAIFQEGTGKHGLIVNNATAKVTREDIKTLYDNSKYAEAWALLRNMRNEDAHTNYIDNDDFSKKNNSGLKDLVCYNYTDNGELQLLHYGRLLLHVRYIGGKLNGRNWGYEYTNDKIGEKYLAILKETNTKTSVTKKDYYKKPRTLEFSYSSNGILEDLSLYVDSETLSYTLTNKTNETYTVSEFPFESVVSNGAQYTLPFQTDSLKKRSEMCHIIDNQLHIYPSGKCSVYVKVSMPYKRALRNQENIYLTSKFGKLKLSVPNHKLQYLKEYLKL